MGAAVSRRFYRAHFRTLGWRWRVARRQGTPRAPHADALDAQPGAAQVTCEFAATAIACGYCETILKTGEWLYRTKHGSPRCEGCARRLHVGPLPAPTVRPQRQPKPLSMERFNRFQTAGTVRGNIRDFKAK